MPKVWALQPRYFERFRCIGADCEDTCCDGWGVVVDQETYGKYQDPLLGQVAGKTLSSLVEINPASNSSTDFAKMRLTGTRCGALREGLCSIQQSLGESYLSDSCSSYPRVLNVTGGAIEASLFLSCPEAARLVLMDPDAMALREHLEGGVEHRSGSLSSIGDAPDEQLRQVRGLMMRMIGERSRPLWQRVASLGLAIEELTRVPDKPATTILEDHLAALRRGATDAILGNRAVDPAVQIETVVELVVTRIGREYTSPRFLECYGDFMRGLGWTAESTIEELAGRYHHALQSYYLPFVQTHEHFFENYLLNYMFRTLFPFGRRQPDTKLSIDQSGEWMRSSNLLLAAHYAIIRTMLIGIAALHADNLNIDHALKLVQSCTKAFQHSNSSSSAILQFLKQNEQDSVQGIVALVKD